MEKISHRKIILWNWLYTWGNANSALSLVYRFIMARPSECNKIRICRTVGEIEYIKSLISESGKEVDIRSYLTREIGKLVRTFNKCPDCVTPAFGDRIVLEYFVNDIEKYQTLQQISFLLNRSVSSMVDDFFIAPLLKPQLWFGHRTLFFQGRLLLLFIYIVRWFIGVMRYLVSVF